MEDPGELLAVNVLLLYTILGPLVLLAIYALFDALAKGSGTDEQQQGAAGAEQDPALWTDEDLNRHWRQM